MHSRQQTPAGTEPLPPAEALPSLAEHFRSAFELGAAVEVVDLERAGPLIAHHFNRLTAENAMKHSRLLPLSDRRATIDADRIADFARQHGMRMTGHTLLWHQMHSPWLFDDDGRAASAELVTERLAEHVDWVVARYADVVDHWDVVNEALSDRPEQTFRDQRDGSRWYETFGGPGYIRLAFELAARTRRRWPTKLYYNDYNVVRPNKLRKVVELVRQLKAEGAEIDGVGIQGHWNLSWPSPDEIRRAIDTLAAEGVDVKVSELDVSVYPEDDFPNRRWQAEREDDPELQAALAARYVEIFRVFLERAEAISSVTLWGVSDDRSWLETWPTQRRNSPLLFDRWIQPKPALRALLSLEVRNRPTR